LKGIPNALGEVSDFDAILQAFGGIDTVLHLSAYTEDVHE